MWIYKNKEVHGHDDLLPECTDFVYMIEYTNGQRYIGKKTVRSKRKKPPLKGKKRCRRVLTNLPFINYVGSHETAEDLEIKCKEILYQCCTRKAATYLEVALMIHHDAIFDPNYLNENIINKFFRNDLDGLLE